MIFEEFEHGFTNFSGRILNLLIIIHFNEQDF